MRAGQRLQQHEQAGRDGQQQPVEHAQREHGKEGKNHDQAIPPPGEVRAQRGRVQRVAHGVDDDGGQQWLRRALYPGQQQPDGQAHHGAGHQACSAALRARHLVGRCGRVARAHGHAMEHARQQVGRAQRHQVAVGIDAVAVAQRKAADGAIGLGIEDERHRKGQFAQAQPFGARQRGNAGVGEIQPYRPHGRNAPARAPAARIQRNAGRNHQQGRRQATPAGQRTHQQQRRNGHGQARSIPVPPAGQQLPDKARQIAMHGLEGDGMRDLLDHDGQRQPQRKAAQHGLGNEIGDRAQPRQPRHHEEQARQQHDAHAQQHALLRRGAGHGRRGRQQHGGRGGCGRDDGEAAGPQQAIGQQPGEQRNHPGLRRQAGDAGIGHGLGQQQAGDGQAGAPIGQGRQARRTHQDCGATTPDQPGR